MAAATAAVPDVAMTLTLSRTNSAAISAARSARPSTQRYSILIVRLSIQPSSPSRCTKAATHWAWVTGVPEPRYPIVGSFADCCARATSGHAVAPPSSVITSRRRIIRSPRPHSITSSASGAEWAADRGQYSSAPECCIGVLDGQLGEDQPAELCHRCVSGEHLAAFDILSLLHPVAPAGAGGADLRQLR